MLSSKKITCKGTLRQVFIRVFRLEIQSVMLFFSTQLRELLPLSPSLWFISPSSPLPSVNKYTVYTYTMCKRGGGYGVLGRRQINTCCKFPLQVNYLRWRHFALLSMSLVLLRCDNTGSWMCTQGLLTTCECAYFKLLYEQGYSWNRRYRAGKISAW